MCTFSCNVLVLPRKGFKVNKQKLLQKPSLLSDLCLQSLLFGYCFDKLVSNHCEQGKKSDIFDITGATSNLVAPLV